MPFSRRWSSRKATFGAVLSLTTAFANAQYDINQKIPEHVPEEQFNKFVTRPDIIAPKWNVTVYDPARISPGYWFLAPYEQVGANPPNPAWVGPQIYDGNGDLVWGSGDMFEGANIFDFRVAKINGSDSMTLISTWADSAFIVDEHYNIRKKQFIGRRGQTINMHDFNMVDDGAHALLLHRNITTAPENLVKDIGFDGSCRAISQWFEVKDTSGEEWKTVFRWDALDHIGLNESTMVDGKCKGVWDFLHSNSADKCPDGHYLLSGRHMDTIFKIDKDDGHVIWRLGGRQSDFESDFSFSRQHHIRCRAQNSTHTIVSLMDNAKGTDSQKATSDYSRGLIIALEEAPAQGRMKASIMSQYAHPSHDYNDGRGNCEPLSNGNVWMGWSDRSLQSEYTADGTMILKAFMVPEWLRSYRNYKFPFVGRPLQQPDVVSRAASPPQAPTTTRVFVSWNGATEVAYWNLYRTDSSGKIAELVASSPRRGFETLLTYNGYASHVVVVALDSRGLPLDYGRSNVVNTTSSAEIDAYAIAQDEQWQEEAAYRNEHPLLSTVQSVAGAVTSTSIAMFFAGAVVSAAIILGLWFSRSALRSKRRWWVNNAHMTSAAETVDGEKGESQPMFDHDQDSEGDDDDEFEPNGEHVPAIRIHPAS